MQDFFSEFLSLKKKLGILPKTANTWVANTWVTTVFANKETPLNESDFFR